jgi:hypothetical protein
MADSDEFDGSLEAVYSEIKYLRGDVQYLRGDFQGLEGRVRMVTDDHEARLRVVETKAIQAEERQRTSTGILGVISLLGSALAAYLGVQR